jgi:hypothetical protein
VTTPERRVTIWAFESLDELGGATGLVETEESVANRLVAAGRVQDPRVGAQWLKPIGAAGTRTYTTRELRAAPPDMPEPVRRAPGRPRKAG